MSGEDRDLKLPPISYVWQLPIRKPKRSEWDIPHPDNPKTLTPAMRAKLQRIVAKTPEVMVKITGKTKSVDHLKSHFEYITRNGELSAETETGALLEGRQGVRDLHAHWADDANLDTSRRRNNPLSVNIILSMPPGTDAVAVKDAVRAFAIETFGGRHDFAFVQHLDDKHPHVHLTVRSLSYEGRRLNPRKADLAEWRERFAGQLRLRGIAAEATPRRTRGKVRKAERGVVRAIRQRGEQPRVERAARQEIFDEARAGKSSVQPSDVNIGRRRGAIREAYEAQGAQLAASFDQEDKRLAQQLREFLEQWRRAETRRDFLRREFMQLHDAEIRKGIDRPPSTRGSHRER